MKNYHLLHNPKAILSLFSLPKVVFYLLISICVLSAKCAEEMDWDKNGMVNFKEFLFAFTRWVGLEDEESAEA